MLTHRLYGKHSTHTNNRFKALDVGNGGLAGNLIYATMFTHSDAVDAQKQLTESNGKDGWQFEIRKI